MYYQGMNLHIARSALRHGITKQDMLHALRNAVRAVPQDDGTVMFIGADDSGRLLEVAVARAGSRQVIVHAMRARRRYIGD